MRQQTLGIKTRAKANKYTVYVPPGLNDRIEQLKETLGHRTNQETINYLLAWSLEQRQDRSALASMQAVMREMVKELAGLPPLKPQRKGRLKGNE